MRKRGKRDLNGLLPAHSSSNNAFIKIGNFLVEKEELDDEDLELIVTEINKQEGEFKDKTLAKHKFSEYNGKHKFHKHTKESNILDTMTRNVQPSGSFLLQSSSELYKPQAAAGRDSHTELYRATSTQILNSEQNLMAGSLREQPNLPSQKQLTTSSKHRPSEGPQLQKITIKDPQQRPGRRDTQNTGSVVYSVSGQVDKKPSRLGSSQTPDLDPVVRRDDKTLLMRIRSKEQTELDSRNGSVLCEQALQRKDSLVV